jgi:hypothetical protein
VGGEIEEGSESNLEEGAHHTPGLFKVWHQPKECDIHGHSPPDNPPCDNTVRGLLQKLKLPWKKVQEGPSINALHESKANETYLCDYFEKLEDLFKKEKATPGIVMKWGSSSVT